MSRRDLYDDCTECGTMHPSDDLEPTENGHMCPECFAEYEYLCDHVDTVVVKSMAREGYTDQEIADELGTSRSNVCRIRHDN